MNSISILLSLFPYLCLIGTLIIVISQTTRKGTPPFMGIMDAAIIWCSAIWLITNILSMLNRVDGLPIGIFWSGYAVILAFTLYKKRRSLVWPERPRGWIYAPIYLILSVSLVVGIIYPPQNWDVFSYHMPRVLHWLQNHTLAPYPTSIVRQIGMPPFNSYILLQSVAIWDGDWFLNLGQWFAFAGCIVGVATIAGQLGASVKGKAYAAFFMATIPAAITQTFAAESCDIVTFWMLCFASLFLSWIKSHDRGIMIRMGFCLGFAILSKGSAYPIALPFVMILLCYYLRHPVSLFRQCAVAACAVIIINLPHYIRAYEAYGSIVGGTETNIVQHPGLGTFTANALYNFLLHEPLVIPAANPGAWNLFANALGVDTTDKGQFPFGGMEEIRKYYVMDDTYGQAPFHAAFLLVILLVVIIRKYRAPMLYTGAVIGSFIVYCFLLTWHPWAGRIHLTMFALAAPVCGMYIDAWKNISLKLIACYLFFIGAILPLFCSQKPVLKSYHGSGHFLFTPREELYFTNNPPLWKPFKGAIDYLAQQKPATIGLDLYIDGFEYPIWKFLKDRLHYTPRIIHMVPGRNDDAKPEYIYMQPARNVVKILKLENGKYVPAYEAEGELPK